MVDARIIQYRQAAAAMKQGRFDVAVPVEPDDEVGRLGQALLELEHVLERQFEQMRKLVQITARVNAGLMLDDVLNYVFESFRPLIPYDRIGFSLIEEDGRLVRARWARTDAPEIKIHAGYAARLEGSSLKRILEAGQPRDRKSVV